MAIYKINITVDEGQDKILKAKATLLNKSPEDILSGLSSSIIDQMNQWISDKVTAKINTLTPAESLSRLEYFDNK